MKKTLCIILAAIMVSLMLPVMTFAGETKPSVTVDYYITDAIYEDYRDFSEGYSAVKLNGKWGYIDESGKTVVEPKYYWAGDWHGGSAAVIEKIEECFDSQNYSHYEVTYLLEELLDKEVQGIQRGTVIGDIIESYYDSTITYGGIIANYFAKGEEDSWDSTYNATGGVYVINKQAYSSKEYDGYEHLADIIINTDTLAKLYNEGYTSFRTSATNSKWIFSADLIPMQAWQFTSADIPVKAFIMDHNGDIAKEFPTNSNAIVVIHDENEEYEIPKESYINEIAYCDSERMIARSGYTRYLVDENEKPYQVGWMGELGLYDLQGNLITTISDKFGDDWKTFWHITNGMLRVVNGNDKIGALDKDGNLVIPAVYDSIGAFTENGFAYAEKDGEMFFIDKKNNRYDIPNPNGGSLTDPKNSIVYKKSKSKNNVFAIYNTDVTYMITYSNGKFVVIDGSVGLGIVGYPENGIAHYYKEDKGYGIAKLHFEGIDGYTEEKDKPSDWAKAEVDAAIAAGLVPKELQRGYNQPVSREKLSKILSVLLDKVYGKAPTAAGVTFTDTAAAEVMKAAKFGIINGYKQSDGTYMFKPYNKLKRCEITAVINRAAILCGKTTTGFESEVKFKDTASHWCNKELGWAVHNGIVKGTSATMFSPENTLTVEQAIMIMYRAYNALK